MGYTEQNLGKDESIVMRGEVNKIAALPNIIVAVIVFLIFAMSKDGTIIVVGLVLAALIIGIKLLKMKFTELSLTSKKIVGKYGIISTKVMDSPINKVNNVAVEQGLGGKIFGYGKIVITTAAGHYDFKYIANPDTFRGAVMNQIDAFEEERIRKQAEQLAGAINR